MGYIVIAAEVATLLWFVCFIGMINGYYREGRSVVARVADPVGRTLVGNAKWAYCTGIAVLYAGSLVALLDVLEIY